MAASSPPGIIFVWNTTPNDPFPTILHCVYEISFISPESPSWTFSRTTSAWPGNVEQHVSTRSTRVSGKARGLGTAKDKQQSRKRKEYIAYHPFASLKTLTSVTSRGFAGRGKNGSGGGVGGLTGGQSGSGGQCYGVCCRTRATLSGGRRREKRSRDRGKKGEIEENNEKRRRE